MPLPLPDPQLPADPRDALESIQRNFDALATASTPPVTAAATFQNSAVAATPALAARKYPSGQVILSGGVANLSGLSNNTTYATLPAGYRPSATVRAAAGTGQTSLNPVTAIIGTDGTVQIVGASVGSSLIAFYLDGITFHAA